MALSFGLYCGSLGTNDSAVRWMLSIFSTADLDHQKLQRDRLALRQEVNARVSPSLAGRAHNSRKIHRNNRRDFCA